MTDQIAFDLPVEPAPAASRKPSAPAMKRALAAYAAGDLEMTAAALDEAWTPSTADLPNPVRGGGDFTILSDHLTWLHAEVPAWIHKGSTLTGRERADAAERCADLIASGADGMFGPDQTPSRARKASNLTVEPQPSEIRTALAEGLGILAHREGGVTFSGQHWCTETHDGCPGTWDVRFKHLHQVEITVAGGKSQGAVFTPRYLAEEVSAGALEAKVYAPGPLDTRCCTATWEQGHSCGKPAWRLRPSADILALRTVDYAVGAGVFLLASARYLADCVLQAWQAEHDGRGGDRGEALRLVIDHCLYGVDINPWSTELAKLNLSLLVPHATVPDLDRHMAVGDTLVGVSDLAQVRWMDLLPDRGRELHNVPRPYTAVVGEFMQAVEEAMRHPRPDLSHPDVWDVFGDLCDLVTSAGYVASSLGDTAARVHLLQAARRAHDLLTADRSWREAA